MAKITGIVQEVNIYTFERAFKEVGRGEQFTYDGLKALFKYLEDLSQDMDEPIELDVIALCCKYTEYESLAEFNEAYDKDYDLIADIKDDTTVINIDDCSFIIADF